MKEEENLPIHRPRGLSPFAGQGRLKTALYLFFKIPLHPITRIDLAQAIEEAALRKVLAIFTCGLNFIMKKIDKFIDFKYNFLLRNA